MNLHNRFFKDTVIHTLPKEAIAQAWDELVTHYEHPNRHYHNLAHLQNLFAWTDRYADHLQTPEAVHWAIWYHDIIYNARRRDNEEQSARLAETRLQTLGVPDQIVSNVMEYIRATAQHLSVKATGDLAWLLDFDLAILGSERAVYENYAAAVRREYAHVPGFLYRRGRKKVLRYFLAAERLYRTRALYDLLEERARENLMWELRR